MRRRDRRQALPRRRAESPWAAQLQQDAVGEYENALELRNSEPYFGWCDVEGCDNEGCSGGNAWRETGYWTVCYKHSDEFRHNISQPRMKQSAIDRESRRGADGVLQ